MTTKFNQNYFDIIDDEHKAYWLGFIWGDGYLGYRIRNGKREEYNLKLSLKSDDYKHLEKFNDDLDGEYVVNYYKHGKTPFCSDGNKEARLFITNKHMGKILRDEYGIIPHRNQCDKITNSIPDELIPAFIRGVIDADGTICKYTVIEDGYTLNKYTIHICGTTFMLRYIENSLIKAGVIQNIERKLQKRHKEESRDNLCRSLVLSGKNNVLTVLNYIYQDASIYLDRKYKKYLEIAGECDEI